MKLTDLSPYPLTVEGETVPIHVEVEYEVMKPDRLLVPHFMFTNQDGVALFSAFDTDPEWRRQPKPVGRYVSSVTIPGNFLSDGTIFVTAGLFTIDPSIKQFYERDVAAFQVVDSTAEDTARGEYGGPVYGVVRPLLPWTTRCESP